ncbi:MAG TPA: DUF1580 domain-containing protein [Terriglobia bacterium]|nr:DUF1580 domain-containing protein [Terriglobia bacterium]
MLSLNEDLLSLRDASEILPRRRRGRKPHFSALWRWSTRGLHGVRLETLRCGGTLVTSREAIQRFFEQLGAMDGQPQQPNPPPAFRTPAQRARDIERADNELKEMGIG